MVAGGGAASTTRNAVLPLRAIYRRAIARGEIMVNPTETLALPAVRGRRERVARPEEAAALIAAVPPCDRAIWVTALYAGLRLGELKALRWQDVDLEANVITVRRSWDGKEGPIAPKSHAGRRRVPISKAPRAHLIAHHLARASAPTVGCATCPSPRSIPTPGSRGSASTTSHSPPWPNQSASAA